MTPGLKGIKTVRDLDTEGKLAGKVVFLRLDLNVPMKDGKISDYNRIAESLPTIQFLMEKGAKLVMASHLGRPKTEADHVTYSLEPIAKKLSELLNAEVHLLEEPDSDAAKALLTNFKKDQLILLENVRFDKGEISDSIEFAQKLANYCDVYVNDAFGVCHRTQATVHALPSIMTDKAVGFLIEKEVTMLDSLLQNPKRPYLAVLGGAKVSDKIAVIERLIDIVDGFVIGGAMAYTFLKAQGVNIGKSRVEADKLRYAKEIVERIKARDKTILLPLDHVATKSIADTQSAHTTRDANIADDELGVDIGPQTIRAFSAALKEAGTVFWNGPMGVFENPAFGKGTVAVAQALADNNGIKVTGGGDTGAAVIAAGLADKMTHISTGGGASLEYLEGAKLPGLEVLRLAKRRDTREAIV